MIADIITFAITHPFITGMVIGGCAFGAPLAIIGWCVGYSHFERKVNRWMRPPQDEAHGNVPNLPPDRPRRWLPEGGR